MEMFRKFQGQLRIFKWNNIFFYSLLFAVARHSLYENINLYIKAISLGDIFIIIP